jgi:hypothetical protein
VESAAIVDLGTYRTNDGELVHCWYDSGGTLMAEREGPRGRVRVDPSILTSMVKLSDDPFWPEEETPVQAGLWSE